MAGCRLRRSGSSSLSATMFAFSCFLACISVALCNDVGVFDSILDNTEPCKEACQAVYSASEQNIKHVECCKRGCRFYTLVELIHTGQNENATRDACTASCMEAYSQTADRYACNIGCSKQVPHTVQRVSEAKDEEAKMGTATPFLYVHNVYNNMLDHMCRMMSVSWSVYFQQDDGQVVLVQTEPEIVAEYLDMEDVEDKIREELEAEEESSVNSVVGDGDGTSSSSAAHKKESLATATGADAKKSTPDIYYYANQGQVETALSDEDIPMRIMVTSFHEVDDRSQPASSSSSSTTSTSSSTSSADWLGCVSRKSGLPRWLLGLIIFFSAVVMVWLCFATSVTSPDHNLKPKVISIYGDIEYLKSGCPIREKVVPSADDDDSDDDILQAAPLPSKEDLQQRLV